MRIYKRIFAALIAFGMSLSVLPSLALTVSADELGEIVVNYDAYPFFEEDFDDEVDHASVYVNGEHAVNAEPFSFNVGEELTFTLNTYHEYRIEDCIFVLTQGSDVFSTDPGNGEYLISLDCTDEYTGVYKFTPHTSTPISVEVYWNIIDTLIPEQDQIRFDIYQWGPGSVEIVDGVEPIRLETAPSGSIRAIYNRSQFGNGEGITVKMTPDRVSIVNFLAEKLDDAYCEYFPEFRDNDPTPIYNLDGLTDNGDGTFTYVIDSFEPYENDTSWYALSVGFDYTFGRRGFSVDSRDTTVYYSLDGGEFTELKMQHFQDEWNDWDELFLDAEILDDVEEITFRFELREDDKEWRDLFGICVESFDRIFERHTYAFDYGDGYEVTLQTPAEGWPACRLQVCDWLIPYDGTYVIYVKGAGAEDLLIDNKALTEAVPFRIGEPIEFSFEGDVYCVCAREYNKTAETILEPQDGVYSFIPENSNGLEFDIYMTEDEYRVDHLWPEADNEYDLEFWVCNEDFPDDVNIGSVEILENEHIVRTAKSCDRNKFVVNWDPEELNDQEAIIYLKVNIPENCEFSLWIDGEDFTNEVYENDNIFAWNITRRIKEWAWYNVEFRFRYDPFGPYTMAVNYDDCYYSDDGEYEPYAHAGVMVNGENVNSHDPVDFEVGKTITFKLDVPDGYDYSDAIIDLHHGMGADNDEVHYTTFSEDPAYRITVDSNGEFTFKPSREDTIWVDIWWSAFDFLHTEGDQLQVEFGHWGNGKIQFADGYEPVAYEVQPGEYGRIRTIFNKDDLDENGTVKVIITPDAGNRLCSFGYDFNDSEFTEYVAEPDEEHSLTLDELTDLVDNGDGTYTYTISGLADADDEGNSWFSFNVGFDNPVNTDGISVDPRGSTVYYSIDGGQFVELEPRHFKDEWNEWDETILLPEEYYDASKVAFKFVYEDERDVSGVSLEYYSDSRHRSNLPFDDETEHIFVLEKPAGGWQPYRLSLLEGYAPYDGTYVIWVQGADSHKVDITNNVRDERVPFEYGELIAFTVEGSIYAVYANIVDEDREIKLESSNGTYSFEADTYGAIEFHVYTTEDEFDFHHTWPEGETRYEVSFWIRENNFPEEADHGSVEVLENDHVVKVASTCNQYRVIVDYDRNDQNFDRAVIDLKINVPENTSFSMWMEGEDITESVIDNNYVFSWDITKVVTGGDWRSPEIYFDYNVSEPERIYLNGLNENISVEYSTDRGQTFVPATDDFIELNDDVEFVQIRYLVSDPNLKIYGIDVRFGDQVIMERLSNDLVYEFERGDHWIKYDAAPVCEDMIFDCEWQLGYVMGDDSENVTITNNIETEGYNRFGRWDTVTIDVEGDVYCIEAEFADGTRQMFERNGNEFTYYAEKLTGFTAWIYVSEEEYDFCNLWAEGEDQYVVQYYSESESELTGTVSVKGEVERASYNGWTKIIFNSEEPYAEFSITPTADYLYSALLGMEVFTGRLYVGDWQSEWPVIEFYAKTNIADAVITLDPSGNQEYTGSEIKPGVTLVLDGVTLTEGKDYNVVYENNVEPGDATVRAEGIGSYCGTASASFKIVKNKFAITITEPVNGTVTVPREFGVLGELIVITATPADNYEVDVIKVDGEPITGTSFVMPAKDVTIEVVFKKVEAQKNGWILDGSDYYYYENGVMKTGWVKDGNSWYYMDPETGKMVTGWIEIGSKWYYMRSSGAMATGWLASGATWYYLESSGAMATGWKSIGGVWYYFDNSGAMATGWRGIGGLWYYFASSGAMYTGWLQSGNDYYYLKSDGSMAANEYCKGYWLKSNGMWDRGPEARWYQDSKGWYYQNGNGWYAKNASYKIDGKLYNFNAAGYCTNP